ncbi:MAG: hypothetical protein DMG05_07425 [Acidobacteria bacterium]|nr:MAG: hypothetical protein DMG05_07425 [Acidobacteriota bacterium]
MRKGDQAHYQFIWRDFGGHSGDELRQKFWSKETSVTIANGSGDLEPAFSPDGQTLAGNIFMAETTPGSGGLD